MTRLQVGGETGPTYLVAASDATDKSKNMADYVCTGTADEVQINAAIAALPALGGHVVLSEGTFNCAASITAPAKPFYFSGQGGFARDTTLVCTLLNFSFGAPADCLIPSNDQYSQIFERFGISGNDANERYGIYMQGGATYKTFRDITIDGVTDVGVKGLTGNSQNYYENIQCRGLLRGFDLLGSANTYIICQASRSSGDGVGASDYGLLIHDDSSVYVGCVAENYDIGFLITSYTSSATLISSFTEECNRALTIDGADPNHPKSIQIYGFKANDSRDGADSAFYIDRCNGVIVHGLRTNGTTSGKGIEIDVNAVDVVVAGGYLTDATPVTLTGGSRLSFQRISGFITENSGTGSIDAAATTDVIAHGLDVTPTVADISITLAEDPTNTPGAIWVDTIGAANFTVNCENVPGASNLDFGWRAAVL